MKFNVIKKLAADVSLADLQKAASALEEGEELDIEVGGDDEGEQLTHILGAIWIIEQVEQGVEFKDAFRQFAQRVRTTLN
jgi:hypothetical protein